MKTFTIISLGCARNLVDSEVMAGSLKKLGLEMSPGAPDADVCVINTCAFIESARRESVDAVMEAVRAKAEGRIKRIAVCGCLPQFCGDDIAGLIPEADLVLGAGDFPKLAACIRGLQKGGGRRAAISERSDYLYNESAPRFKLTPGHYAYVKISEGCSNLCSYCVISRLRGAFRSRTIASVVKEVERLSRGTRLREINLIGQDTTLFGVDIYGVPKLPELLRKLCRLKNSVRWVRLLYTHPAHYDSKLISVLKSEGKIARYLDLPIQHISDKILKLMNRSTTKRDIASLVDKLRKDIRGLALRTTVIVGFPGETDRDFRELLNYVRRTRFERLGAFIYSKEEGTPASGMKGQVPMKVKRERLDELMRAQQKISSDINNSFIGKTIDVLIDEKLNAANDKRRTTNDEYYGRTEADAPEIDCGVHVSGPGIKVGEFRRVKITGAMEYDLIGEVL